MNDLRELLRIEDFRRMWFGQIVSDFGDGMTLLGLLILTQRLTGSTVALAGVAIAATLPMIIFGIPAGALVDRMDRRHAMIIADLGRAAAVAGFMIVRSPDLMWLLYGLAFVQASIGTLFTPAKSALIPLVVPEDKLLAATDAGSRMIAGNDGLGAMYRELGVQLADQIHLVDGELLALVHVHGDVHLIALGCDAHLSRRDGELHVTPILVIGLELLQVAGQLLT